MQVIFKAQFKRSLRFIAELQAGSGVPEMGVFKAEQDNYFPRDLI
jgi:hypothetical protein